jgi:Holliday junction resolvase RusA-like endonuclease
MKFEVPGDPKGKARPRVCFKGKRAWAYTPKNTRSYESLIKKCARDSKVTKLEGSVYLSIEAVFKVPKSATKSKKEEMLKGKIRPTKKPDMDNIAKTVMDALNGIAYDDDKQVGCLQIVRRYGEEGMLVIWVESDNFEE